MSGARSKQPLLFGLLASLIILALSQVLEWFINRELRPDFGWRSASTWPPSLLWSKITEN